MSLILIELETHSWLWPTQQRRDISKTKTPGHLSQTTSQTE